MSKTYIHIGFPKCASTFLQRNVFSTLEGMDYLTPPYTQHDEYWNQLQYADGSLFKFEKNFNPDISCLISDEGLVGKPIYNGMMRTEICERLSEKFPDAKILMLIRNQFDIILSLHNQWVKGARKGAKTVGDFIWYQKEVYSSDSPFTLNNQYFNTNQDFLHLDFLKYEELFDLYSNYFDSVTVLPLELLETNPKMFFKILSEFLDQEIPVSTQSENKLNTSISNKELCGKIVDNSMTNLKVHGILKKAIKIMETRHLVKKQLQEEKDLFHLLRSYYSRNNLRLVEKLPSIFDKSIREKYWI